MPDTTTKAPKAAPLWRRALAWTWGTVGRFAVWLWTKLRTGATTVWAKVRDPDSSRGKRVAWGFGGLVGAGAVAGVAGFVLVVAYALVLWPFTPSVGDLRDAREIDPSTVVSADGTTLTRYARRGREWRALEDVSPHVVTALVSTEDRRFYDHHGVDLLGWAAVLKDVSTGRGMRGASTITQQLARNLFPDRVGNAASVTRKLREAITALKIEGVYSKDEILELYLNTVPFLYNAHGIEMAARTYFSTDAGSLDVVQSATLVGMLKGTSMYNPYRRPERALARRNVVIGQMVKFGGLDPAEGAALEDEPLGLRFERQSMQRSLAPHFTEHVRVMLEDWGERNGYSIYGDGLTIHTTLDMRMQRAAEESTRKFGDALQTVADVEWGRGSAERLGPTTAPYYTASRTTQPFERFWDLRRSAADAFVRDTRAYRRGLEAGREPDAVLDSLRATPTFLDSLRQVKMRLEVAMTAVDPSSGHVKVWIGSRDYGRSAYDHVARARRQPGSTFKPFLYARALEEGWRPDDTLVDGDVAIEMSDGVVWQPTNANGRSSGELVTLSEGLSTSKNTIAAQLVQDVGARDLARTARRMGIESRLEAVPALALGTSEVSLLEMTGAYATIASGGVRRPPVVVTHITDRDGLEVARFDEDHRTVLDDDVAVDLLDMMRGVVDSGTGSQIRSSFGARGDLAGKTGTTQDGADGWFLLMRPDLVTGAWVGFDDPRVTFRSAYWGQGGHNALRVVGDFHRTAQRQGFVDTALEFPRPPDEAEGPGMWDRFSRWAGDTVAGWFEPDDLPSDYGPRTPGRDRYDSEPVERPRGRPDRSDPREENLEWFEEAWADLDQIEDPFIRDAAREVLRRAAQEFERSGGRDGWAERIRDARDRAISQAARELEREVGLDGLDEFLEEQSRDRPLIESGAGGVFEDEEVLDGLEAGPVEEAPVEPEAPSRPDRPGDVPPEAGRIGW
ncbi:penicillin-binding protein 1A [Rubrivirga sp.]|uniref:penicillin-binding protein 1A n=1 Tax=Rubrivirga sp. TaxID=1885344 RepID=UPI003C7254A6